MESAFGFLDHKGEMAARIRSRDWSATAFGAIETWPSALRFAVDICLGSSFPTAIYWGPELNLLYNDAWSSFPGDRHPWALGRPAHEVWAHIWDVVGVQMARTLHGQGFATYDQMLPMERGGKLQDTWWNYSLTPIRDESGKVVGTFTQGSETTRAVLAERDRMAEADRLRDLFQQAPAAVALVHGPDFVFEMINPAFLDLVGNRDLIGRRVADALPEIAEQGGVDRFRQVYRTGEECRASERAVSFDRTPGGAPETRILDYVLQPIKDAAGATVDILVLATDVTERAQAQEALRQSEQRLELALDSSLGVGTWDWDVQPNRVTADVRFARLYGVDPGKAAQGAPIEAFFGSIHPDDDVRVKTAVARAIEKGDRFVEEYRLLQPDGSVRWVTAQGRCGYDQAGKPSHFPGVSFDISERKLAEEAARNTAEELRAATETQLFLHALAERQRALDTPDAIMRFTAGSIARRMKLDRVGFYRVLGEGIIQFGPCWTSGALPPLHGTMPVESLGASVRDGYRAGKTAVHSDGAIETAPSKAVRLSPSGIGVPLKRGGQWVASLYANQAGPHAWTADEIAFIEAVAEASWDAVERLEALSALKDSEAKFRGIANSIDQMVWSARPDGQLDYFNERWYEFTHVDRGSSDGDGWLDLLHPDDRAPTLEIWRGSIASGEPCRAEYRLRHHADGYRWVLARATPGRDEAGKITRWFGSSTDIQEIVDARDGHERSRIALEQEVEQRTRALIETEDQLRQAQKMEAVGQLTGGVAHDFNNMLAVVIGALDLIERRVGQGETDVERYVTAARDAAGRAAGLTERLLAFSRDQPLAPVPVDMNQMMFGMSELLIRTLGEAVTVGKVSSADLHMARVDPNQLQHAILNLSVNARDAMPRGGTLTIETANVTLGTREAQGFDVPPGDYVQVAITDTGSGMTRDVLERAFDPFFTTRGAQKRAGLGLSQVFGFVRQSGGHVRIESEIDRGTTARLYFPRYTGPSLAEPAATPAAEPPNGNHDEVVLVVEDEERLRNFSVEALRELGYSVVDAPGGREALRMIETGQRVSLLFTDIVMPEMNGIELARAARVRRPGLRVLYTTGYTPDALAEEEGTLDDVLAKPFDFARLGLRVRAALDAASMAD
jgi:PAS domain S-box-containing protein